MAAPVEISASSANGLVSILIPCCGMLEYTKLCVASVLKHSRSPYELIFLDIGSLDGTADFLAGIRMALSGVVRVEIVRTATDLGIKDACRDSLREIRGEYLCLLNNDTVVTPGWLNAMTALAAMSPGIGLVGPMSNYAAPPQLVESVPYRVEPRKGLSHASVTEKSDHDLVDVSAVTAYCHEFREKHKGKWLETDRLGGFCLLLKREVFKKLNNQGELDKYTDLSLFDTDVLSMKARQAGYTLAVCRDLYIHHFGTRTFAHGAPKGPAERTVGSNR